MVGEYLAECDAVVTQLIGGDPSCNHEWLFPTRWPLSGRRDVQGNRCACGAWRQLAFMHSISDFSMSLIDDALRIGGGDG